jgi:hypothetical protein
MWKDRFGVVVDVEDSAECDGEQPTSHSVASAATATAKARERRRW